LHKHIHTNFKNNPNSKPVKELTPQQIAAKEEVHKFLIMFNITRNTNFKSNEFINDKDDDKSSFLV